LNYSLIKNFASENKISLKDLAEKINLSEQGLHSGIKNQTLSVTNLEKISKVLNVPISKFFDDKIQSDKVEEAAVVYGNTILSDREKIIMLEATITELRGQVEYFRKLYEESIKAK
jgi:transcriptional regulator with XRE-family HTH domain